MNKHRISVAFYFFKLSIISGEISCDVSTFRAFVPFEESLLSELYGRLIPYYDLCE